MKNLGLSSRAFLSFASMDVIGARWSRASAARSITLITQQQKSSTEQVSQNVRSVAEVVQQAAISTAQTRASARGLKEQADRLAALVARFELARERD